MLETQVVKMANEQLTTNYKVYKNRNVKIMSVKDKSPPQYTTVPVTSDCGNTFSSFSPTNLSPLNESKSKIRNLLIKPSNFN